MSDILEERRRIKEEDDRYREAARRLTGGIVAELESVNRPASKQGAFVSVTIWIPITELAPPSDLKHVYARCTRTETDSCSGCSPDSGMDCKYEALGYCTICGGLEGALLPSCPGRMLTSDEHDINYKHYCAGTGPFAGTR